MDHAVDGAGRVELPVRVLVETVRVGVVSVGVVLEVGTADGAGEMAPVVAVAGIGTRAPWVRASASSPS